jgi:hypothetical protein
MKKDTLYYILIIFIIYLALKKSLDILIDFKYPTYHQQPTGIWKYLVTLRDYFSIFTLICCVILLIIISTTSNTYLIVILISYLTSAVLYLFIDKGFIWNLISKNPTSEKIIDFMDIYLDSLVNLLLGLFCFYAILYIFYK